MVKRSRGPSAARVKVHIRTELYAAAPRRMDCVSPQRAHQKHGAGGNIEYRQAAAAKSDEDELASIVGNRADGRHIGHILTGLHGREVHDVAVLDRELLVGVIRPDADQLLLGDIGADRHPHVRGRPCGVRVLSQAHAPYRRAGAGVQEDDMPTGDIRDDGVLLVLGEEDHMGPLGIAAGYVLAGLGKLVTEVDRLGLRGFGI